MADAHALGACAERREGSTPSFPTNFGDAQPGANRAKVSAKLAVTYRRHQQVEMLEG